MKDKLQQFHLFFFVILSQLYSINYPSLCDNNILRRVLVSEVLYWAEKLKSRWIERDTDERRVVSALCQTEGGGEERLSEQHMQEIETGKHLDRWMCLV